MPWQAEANDIVSLSFGLKRKEVERLLPTDVSLDTRDHDGDEYGFLTLCLLSYKGFYYENFPLLALDFPQGFLGVSIVDEEDNPSFYLKRLFLPRLQGLLLRWFGGLPTRVMSMDYPTRAHPGGEYRWKLRNSGAGILRGKIERNNGTAGRLSDFFADDRAMVDFFWDRKYVYTGSPGSLDRLIVSLSDPDPRPIVFEKMELGFLAEDLERHQFPEAVIGSFFVGNASVRLSGPESASL